MKEPVIICVDDEEFVLKSLKRELNNISRGKYLIETANGGDDALELFEELLEDGHEIPLVISDHIMPGMKGSELLKRIHDTSPKTLKIMLTGQADMEAVTSAVNTANLYRYIAKPWEPTDFALTVKEAIRRYFQERAIEKQNDILRNVNKVLEQKVQERTAELETLTVELKQLNASKDKFFSIIAHDLRNPFTGLLGITDFIVKNIEKFKQQEIKENVASLRDSAETVYALIENLLAWSRIQRGVMEHHPEAIFLDEIAEYNVRLFASTAKQKQISLSNQVPKGTMVYADKNMIDTVMRNLVSNALKFTYPNGIVAISARHNEGVVELAISDTGTGIPEANLSQMFRIDVKYSNVGTSGEEGTGLGLILCKDLVEKNGGTIRVESEVGQGTVFTISLPSGKERAYDVIR